MNYTVHIHIKTNKQTLRNKMISNFKNKFDALPINKNRYETNIIYKKE